MYFNSYQISTYCICSFWFLYKRIVLRQFCSYLSSSQSHHLRHVFYSFRGQIICSVWSNFVVCHPKAFTLFALKFLGNIKQYVHFHFTKLREHRYLKSFHVSDIICLSIERTTSFFLLMDWWSKEPGHQSPLYWPSYPALSRFSTRRVNKSSSG